MKHFFLIILLFSTIAFAQVTKPVQRDPYLQNPIQNQPQKSKPEDQIHIKNADEIKKDPTKYDGNRFFLGNVVLEHKGSVLSADEVIIYDQENFVKAIGNVKLQNADGSVITAKEMEYDANTQKGVARGNVVLNDSKGTIIKTETLYYDRLSNLAYYNTGGTISDGKSVTYSKSATYNLASRTINLTDNVKIEDKDYILEGRNVVQNQITNIVDINGYTVITNRRNPKNRVITEKGTYNLNTKEAHLNKNSKIYYNDKILTGDRMYFNEITGFGTATGNVTLDDPLERRYVKGGYGEIFQKKDSAMITKNPYAVKILEKDSIYFASQKIITFQKPDLDDPKIKKSFIRAFRKARIYKSNAQARADSISFNETDGVMHLFVKPILWSGEKQVTGDKIEIFFNTKNENIDSMKVIGNAMAISKVDSLNMKDEFNQVKGKLINVYYEGKDIKDVQVVGNAQAITYADDFDEKTNENQRIGITLSSCGIIGAMFDDKQLQILSCTVGVQSATYPMSKIAPDQKKFKDFNWNTKDRIRKWQDILVDSPDYETIVYTPEDTLYNKVQEEKEKERAKEEAKKPKRVKK